MTFLGQLVQSTLWHHRLGHPTNNIVSLMLNKAHVHVSKTPIPLMCHPCLEGKFSKLPFPQHVNKSVTPFDTIHTDLWGPAPSISVDGYRYYTIFVDECTRYCWIFPLVNKSDFFLPLLFFIPLFLLNFPPPLKLFKLMRRGGGEYTSNQLKLFLLNKGISHRLACPYTPE
jgi:hypothetical protein